jgi:hypothetical protein
MRSVNFIWIAVILHSSASLANDEWLTGKELRQAFSGNTLSGFNDEFQRFSEWHAPDGRVLGQNDGEHVENGCWDVKNDQICYYYSSGSAPGEFCWRIRLESGGRVQQTMTTPEPGFRAYGNLTSGNPQNHSENGKSWTCQPLSSEKRSPNEPTARHARR